MYYFTTSALDLTAAPLVGRINGWHISAGGTASVVTLRHASASGQIFAEIKIAANTSVHYNADHPLLCPKGVYVTPDANTSRGTIIPG